MKLVMAAVVGFCGTPTHQSQTTAVLLLPHKVALNLADSYDF
jgi:hypothetical protein